MKPRNVLVPVDFSPGAKAALRDAAGWAARNGASLAALHVLLPPPTSLVAVSGLAVPALEPAQAARVRRALEAELAAFVEGALGKGHGAACAVEEGLFVPETAVEHARKVGADLLCFSAHGRRGFRRLLLGSTAEDLLRKSPVASLVLRYADEASPAPSLASTRTVLACVDLSEHSRAVLACAAAVVEPGGTLVAAHVVEAPPSYGLYGDALVLPAESVAAAREWAQVALARLLEGVEGDHVETLRVAFDRPARGIVALKQELKPDLTVLGTRGPHGPHRLLLGSVAERVIRQAVGPVLVVPAG